MGRVDPDDDDELERLERRVARMRRLGVLQWGDLILGDPPPAPEESKPADEQEGDGENFPGWPLSNSDVYLDEFSYAAGVPHLRRDDQTSK
jgi:hypothetical protein